MAIGRLISFLLGIIGGGLLQIWLLVAVLRLSGQAARVAELLGDGGLFFFATSLAVSSLLTLCDAYPPRVGTADFNLTAVLVGTVMLVAVTYYVGVLTGSLGKTTLPFAKYWVPQLVCTSAALLYWFYVGVRTGMFQREVT